MSLDIIESCRGVGVFYLAAAATPILLYLYHFSTTRIYSGFLVAGKSASDSFDDAKKRWLEDPASVTRQGLKESPGCFQVITSSGPKIILPGKLADEIRNNPNLHFLEAIHREFFGRYPGFEIFKNDFTNRLAPEMVRGRLTQSLNQITPDLDNETTAAVSKLLGEPTRAWTRCQYKPIIMQIVAQVSSRVFVGPELCANEDWLDVVVNVTTYSFAALGALTTWPILLRPFVHRFLPEVRKVKQYVSKGRQILKPVIEERRAQSGPAAKTADALGWFDEVAKGAPYDEVQAQLGLSLAAIHTTSELTSIIIADLCDHPEWFEPLRQEMSAAIESHGWSKKALQEMRLTDSLMKESQRHQIGADSIGMQRVASKSFQLSDGTRIPKDGELYVALDKMEDPTMFPDPWSYNPRRFLDMRQQPGQENKWQFVTTSPEHLGFGHGKHSCPGRFFASNEIKVILIHLVLKYDWKWATEGRKKDLGSGAMKSADPSATAMIKIRDDKMTLGCARGY